MDIAQVMRLRPSLLAGSVPFAPETVAEILKQPVSFLALNPRTLEDIYGDIRALGRLTSRAQKAEMLVGKMRREFKGVAAKAARAETRTRVYCEAWPNPRISSPPWVEQLVAMAGGKMVVAAGARVRDEEIAAAAPDVIILAWAAAGGRSKTSTALGNPKWRNVPAVLRGRVSAIRDELLNTPGPPLMRGAWELFRALHPEIERGQRAASGKRSGSGQLPPNGSRV